MRYLFFFLFFYCHSLKATNIEIDFGTKRFPLKGVLSLPSQQPKALLLLLHGSGILDENSSIGPNKIFLDISQFFYKENIAVFRFPKRTFTYKNYYSQNPPLSVKEEVLDDVYKAIESLRNVQSLSKTPLFLLGHSQGAALAAHVALFDKKIAGVIAVAPPARKAFELFTDQLKHLAQMPGEHQKHFQNQYDLYKKFKDPIKDKKIDQFLGFSKIYWNEWNHLITAAPNVMNKIKKPLLVIGLGQDYQVTEKDFFIYKNTLQSNSLATCLWVDDVNHMLFHSLDKHYRSYLKKNKTYPFLLKKILEWMTQLPNPND